MHARPQTLDRALRGSCRGALAVLIAPLLTAGCGGTPPGPRAILVTCDTLRRDHLGVYGCERETTPSLDAFAKGCVVYDNAWSSAPFTAPALSSLMTGRLPDELGTASNRHPMPGAATTIAEVARDAGFETAAVVSNWVLRKREGGADEGLEQGFAFYDDRMEDTEANRSNVAERLAGGTTDAALAWLADADARGVERFFLWVHYQDPHGPYTPPDEFIRPFATAGAEAGLRLGKTQQGFGELPNYQAIGSERRPSAYRAWYDAEIRYFDAELGRLFDGLETGGWLDGTLVVFTSDHGESLGEHDWWFSHGQTLFSELVHVPFLVRYPRGLSAPRAQEDGGYRRVDALVGHLDVPSTVLAALGLAPMPNHGVSLVGNEPPEGRVIPQQLRAPAAGNRWESITDGRWRVLSQSDQILLFDIEADPGETKNLMAREPAVYRELTRRRDEMLASLPKLGERAQEETLTAEEKAKLEGLGYTGDDEDEE